MTMKVDEISRLRAAFTAPAPAAGGCPEPDRIWEAIRGELPPKKVREIVDHVALCASCAEDWRIAVAFEKESQNQRKNVVLPFPARRFQRWIAAAAAVLVLSVGWPLYRQMHKVAPEAPYRGTGPNTGAVAEQMCPRQACVLTWPPAEGAESYELLVSTPELTTVAALKGLTAAQYQVPASTLADLPSGTQLQCIVTAVFPDGREEQVSNFIAAVK